MNYNELELKYQQVEELIAVNQVAKALMILKTLIDKNIRGELLSEFENLQMHYGYLLKYNIIGTKDPKQNNIYSKIKRSVLDIFDKLLQDSLIHNPEMNLFSNKYSIISEPLNMLRVNEILDQMGGLPELDDLMAHTDKYEEKQIQDEKYFKLLNEVFDCILFTTKYNEANVYLISALIHSEHVKWYAKSLFVSSLTLSLIKSFDTVKFDLLVKAFQTGETEIWERALAGLVFAIIKYEKRLPLYPSLMNQIGTLSKVSGFNKQIELLALQSIKTADTEKVSKKIQEELLPEVMKAAPKLTDKLDIENILSEFEKDDKNPDWETYFSDSPDLYKMMEELSNLQMEGADVFIGAFSSLKHFSFFNHISSWLIPYVPENILLQTDLQQHENKDMIGEFMKLLQNAPYLCNSDKYSFSLNLKNLPRNQLGMMLELFTAEIESMKELQLEDEKLNKTTKSKIIYAQYLQDLYRFHKLYPHKKEFSDIFESATPLYKNKILLNLISENNILRTLAEFYFEKDHYALSSEIFLLLEENNIVDTHIFQKTGYAFQKLRDFNKALEYYLKADMADNNNPWNLKKIALCYRFLKDHENALKFYREAEILEPDNLYVLAYIGHTYFDLKDYDNALSYYFKVEYHAPNNHKVLRPIAWISLIQRKWEVALNYYTKIPEKEISPYDLINTGHIYFSQGDKEKAAEYYLLSVKHEKGGIETLEKALSDDSELLMTAGIDSTDIQLMTDYITLKIT